MSVGATSRPGWIVMQRGRPTFNINAMIKDLRAEYPKEKQTARTALKLLQATDTARRRMFRVVTQAELQSTYGQKPALIRELLALQKRLVFYKAELRKVKPGAPVPKSVLPLIWNVKGVNHPSPDAFTPFTVGNMLQALKAHYETVTPFLALFLKEAERFPKRVWDKTKKKAAELLDPDTSFLPWALAGAGMAFAGIVAWRVTR